MSLQKSSTVRLPPSHANAKDKFYRGEFLIPQNPNFEDDVSSTYSDFTKASYEYLEENYKVLVKESIGLSKLLSDINNIAFQKRYAGISDLSELALPGKYRSEYPIPKVVYIDISLIDLDKAIGNYPQDVLVNHPFIELTEEEINFLTIRKIDPNKVRKCNLGTPYLKGLNPVSKIFPYGFLVEDTLYKGRFYYANPLEIHSILSFVEKQIQIVEKLDNVNKEQLIEFNRVDKIADADENLLEILSNLAHIFRCLVIAHPFLTVNNSIIMLLTNYILEQKGFYPIPNLKLDFDALFLSSYDFETHFINVVREYMLWEWD